MAATADSRELLFAGESILPELGAEEQLLNELEHFEDSSFFDGFDVLGSPSCARMDSEGPEAEFLLDEDDASQLLLEGLQEDDDYDVDRRTLHSVLTSRRSQLRTSFSTGDLESLGMFAKEPEKKSKMPQVAETSMNPQIEELKYNFPPPSNGMQAQVACTSSWKDPADPAAGVPGLVDKKVAQVEAKPRAKAPSRRRQQQQQAVAQRALQQQKMQAEAQAQARSNAHAHAQVQQQARVQAQAHMRGQRVLVSRQPMQGQNTHMPIQQMQGQVSQLPVQPPQMQLQPPQMAAQATQMPLPGPQMPGQLQPMPAQSQQLSVQTSQMPVQAPQMPMHPQQMQGQLQQMPVQPQQMQGQLQQMPVQPQQMQGQLQQMPVQGSQRPMQVQQMPMQPQQMQGQAQPIAGVSMAPSPGMVFVSDASSTAAPPTDKSLPMGMMQPPQGMSPGMQHGIQPGMQQYAPVMTPGMVPKSSAPVMIAPAPTSTARGVKAGTGIQPRAAPVVARSIAPGPMSSQPKMHPMSLAPAPAAQPAMTAPGVQPVATQGTAKSQQSYPTQRPPLRALAPAPVPGSSGPAPMPFPAHDPSSSGGMHPQPVSAAYRMPGDLQPAPGQRMLASSEGLGGVAHPTPSQPEQVPGMSSRRAQQHLAPRLLRRVHSTGDIMALNGHHLRFPGLLVKSNLGGDIEEAKMRIGKYTLEERRHRILRYRQKRHERNFNKKIKYACRKTLADSRPRVRGRFAKGRGGADEMDEDYDEDEDEDDESEMAMMDAMNNVGSSQSHSMTTEQTNSSGAAESGDTIGSGTSGGQADSVAISSISV